MTKRIWELDALRGICILGMVAVHLIYDFGSAELQTAPFYRLALNWGGVLFVLLSGISITLSARWLTRGSIVFGCGMLCTAVTWIMEHFGWTEQGMCIVFGVLHCLGVCMLLWSIFRHFTTKMLTMIGVSLWILGSIVSKISVLTPWLIPLGLTPADFASADYFPLLPHLGFFLLGAALGRRLYPQTKSLFPRIQTKCLPVSFLCACGRHSLGIYLLHQPVIFLCAAIFSYL